MIYPGEEFYRHTGLAHFTVKCATVFDGAETRSIWEAVLPVDDIILTIATSFATGDAAAAKPFRQGLAHPSKLLAVMAVTERLDVAKAIAIKCGVANDEETGLFFQDRQKRFS